MPFMMNRSNIEALVYENIADVFMMTPEEVRVNPETRFREDLAAVSLQYFPLISNLEEELDIALDFKEFQIAAPTFTKAVDFVWKTYEKQMIQ